jgi:hypothetical protein
MSVSKGTCCVYNPEAPPSIYLMSRESQNPDSVLNATTERKARIVDVPTQQLGSMWTLKKARLITTAMKTVVIMSIIAYPIVCCVSTLNRKQDANPDTSFTQGVHSLSSETVFCNSKRVNNTASILFGHDPAFCWLPVRPSAPTFPLLRIQTNC